MKFLTTLATLSLLFFTALPAQALEGRASWYGRETCRANGTVYGVNCRTANGELFNENGLTAAGCNHTFPRGSRVRVTNLANNRSVVVRVTDTGGFCRWRGRRARILDLSRGAMSRLGGIRSGVINVRANRE